MKIGVSLAVYEDKSAPWVYSGGDILKNMTELKEIGIDGVDLFVDRMSDSDIENMKTYLDKSGIEVAMLVAFYIGGIGASFSDQSKNKRAFAIEEYKKQIDVAAYLKALTMPIGYNRGKLAAGRDYNDYLKYLAESLAEVSEYGAKKGVKVCLEPINRYEMNTFMALDETCEFIDKFGLKDLKILADLYHMNIEDGDMAKAIIDAGDKIAHMHVSDGNRRIPGTGHIDYLSCLGALKQIGYEGYLSAECLPLPSSYECAKQSNEYLRKILAQLDNANLSMIL